MLCVYFIHTSIFYREIAPPLYKIHCHWQRFTIAFDYPNNLVITAGFFECFVFRQSYIPITIIYLLIGIRK